MIIERWLQMSLICFIFKKRGYNRFRKPTIKIKIIEVDINAGKKCLF